MEVNEVKSHQGTPMFTAALFTITQRFGVHQRMTDKRNVVHPYNGIVMYYSAIIRVKH